jgi:hypothetical protein
MDDGSSFIGKSSWTMAHRFLIGREAVKVVKTH